MQAADFTEHKSGELIRNLSGDLCFLAAELPPKIVWTDELVGVLSAASAALGQLNGFGRHLANPKLLLRSFLRREAELSSRIEGTHAGLREQFLFEQTQSVEQRNPDVREVDNNFRALEWGLEQVQHRPISLNLIRQMHQILLADVRGADKSPGEFRNVQAHIGRSSSIADATFVPAPPQAILPAMQSLEAFIQSPGTLHPLVRVAMIHYQFEAIHPFRRWQWPNRTSACSLAAVYGEGAYFAAAESQCLLGTSPSPVLRPSPGRQPTRSMDVVDRVLCVRRRL